MAINLPVVEFYITNVCNLSCRGCNRFNNYNFKGHQRWNDHALAYETWSKRLDIDHITIIGGEPTLNPDLELWASNLRRLWPKSEIMIQTNGTYIKPHYLNFWDQYQVGFAVSLHDIHTAEQIMTEWKTLFGKQYNSFLKGFIFHQSSVVGDTNHITLHSNDIKKAFNCCDMKYDHTMFNGKLYKCPMTAIIPEFYQQFNLNLDARQKQLLSEYQPLVSDCAEQQLNEFVQQRDVPIKQCEFCPTNLIWDLALGPSNPNLIQPEFNDITPEEIPFYKKLLT